MNASSDSEVVGPYLLRLQRMLRPLPVRDRVAIVAEIEGHIAERTREPNTSVAEVLAGLGDPAALARIYLEHYEPNSAPSFETPGPLSTATMSRAARGFAAYLAGLVAVLLYTFGLSFAAVAALKPIAPRSVGFWISPGNFVFGLSSSPGGAAAEVMGFRIVPVSLLAAMLCYLAASASMKLFVRLLPRRFKVIAFA